MRKIRQYLCALLALLMVFSLVACGGSADEKKPAEQEVVATEAKIETTEAPTEPEKKEMSTPDLAEYVQARTVTVDVQTGDGSGSGSGFFIDDEGTLVTNYHVIDAAESITVKMNNGGIYEVKKIVDFSELYDIAVLSVDLEGNDYLNIAEGGARTGETVYAVGSSLGFLDGTFSDGIVSTASRTVGMIDCLQITAAISNGNSGGPLVNAFGEVIGINAFSYNGGENLNLAIDIDTLDELSMDKNWNLSQFREWYKKEINRSYNVYDYELQELVLSKINTYQHVTGEQCFASSYNWDFLEGDDSNVVNGYDDEQGIYWYEYDVKEFDQYTEYLNENGFSFLESKDYNEGISYFYMNEFTGYCVDLFILAGDEYIMIEPYCNRD